VLINILIGDSPSVKHINELKLLYIGLDDILAGIYGEYVDQQYMVGQIT